MKIKILLAGLSILLLQTQSHATLSDIQDPTLLGYSLSYWVGSGPTYTDGVTTTATPDDWTTNDLNQNDRVLSSGAAAGFFGGSQVAVLGGIYNTGNAPSDTHVELWAPMTAVDFSVKLALQPSTNGHNDAFGWTFKDAAGTELFNVKFTPLTQDAGSAYEITYSGYQSGVDTQWIIGAGNFTLNVSTNLAGRNFWVSIPDGSSPVAFEGVTTVGTESSTIASIGATWDILSSNGAGDYGTNVMDFAAISVETVPEPSTVVLTLTGLGALALWQRNRKRA